MSAENLELSIRYALEEKLNLLGVHDLLRLYLKAMSHDVLRAATLNVLAKWFEVEADELTPEKVKAGEAASLEEALKEKSRTAKMWLNILDGLELKVN